MDLGERIKSFEILGKRLYDYHENSTQPEMSALVGASRLAVEGNPWFTPEHVRIALNNLGKALMPEHLSGWLSAYRERIEHVSCPKRVAVVMAGNIPAVGFHDFLCVLVSGHKIIAKLSSADNRLLPAMANILFEDLPEWQNYISFTTEKLENFDAIIATGSANTSRYFEFYFGKYPHIIRKNRNSIAILTGNETKPELANLSNDIMLFFGMGCRSVSKIYVPAGYDFSSLIMELGHYGHYANHHKYRNNYEYFKSVFMVSQIPFIDTGFVLLKEDHTIPSRIAVLHYEYYKNHDEVVETVRRNSGSIQCIISNIDLPVRSCRPGEGQNPALWDYADQVDTMEFLLS